MPVFFFVLLFLPSLAFAAEHGPVLTVVETENPPHLDGRSGDIWAKAPETIVRLHGGANLHRGESTVALQAMRYEDRLFLLVRYNDPDVSLRRSPWQKQEDGSWLILKDPNDRGSDNNLHYEDKLAFFWNVSSPSFKKEGCAASCHLDEGKPYGNHYNPKPGELVDIWHLKTVRTIPVGKMDDQYLTAQRYDPKTNRNAGRSSDPNSGGGYKANKNAEGTQPAYAAPGNAPAGAYWILDRDKVAFDDAAYKPGDEVAGIYTSAYQGDRGDINAAANWEKGIWTCEIERKLETGSAYDVQFKDLAQEYHLGVAVFDNAQVRHAFHEGAIKLVFE
jgi:hypothetical protein